MPTFTKLFLKGLAAILPIGLTLYLLYWIGTTAERTLGAALKRLLPDDSYVPGMGVVAGFVAVMLIGLLMNTLLAKELLGLGERMLSRIPGVKTVISALKDVMSLFGGDGKKQMGQVVLVRWGSADSHILGFLTRDRVDDLGLDEGEDRIAVYLPFSYQIGGFTVLVPRDSVRQVAMTAEEALRFTVTAGMSRSKV
jgi:uncharacterized membrane protein